MNCVRSSTLRLLQGKKGFSDGFMLQNYASPTQLLTNGIALSVPSSPKASQSSGVFTQATLLPILLTDYHSVVRAPRPFRSCRRLIVDWK